MQTIVKNHKSWYIISLILAIIILFISSILLIFAYVGFKDGEYPAMGYYSIYTVNDKLDIFDSNSAVIVDTTLELERGCAVVFNDPDNYYNNEMDIMYLHDWNDDHTVLMLSDADLEITKQINVDSVKGRAVYSIPFLGGLLSIITTLPGVLLLLLLNLVVIAVIVMMVRLLLKNNNDNKSECLSTETFQSDKIVEATTNENMTLFEPINDDIEYLVQYSNENIIEYLFKGNSESLEKLAMIMSAAKEKKKAESISVEMNNDEIRTLTVSSDRNDEAIIISIIEILKNKK